MLNMCHSLCGSVDWNTSLASWIRGRTTSLLMWECGLKPVDLLHPRYTVAVTPYVGVWIETLRTSWQTISWKSLLMWECGLKRPTKTIRIWVKNVTPYVGVWIETRMRYWRLPKSMVTPYVGVWIETLNSLIYTGLTLSLLMWECGLKHHLRDNERR